MKKKTCLLMIIWATLLLTCGCSASNTPGGDDTSADQSSTQETQMTDSIEGSQQTPAADSTEESPQTPGTTKESETSDPQIIIAPDFTVYDASGNEIHLSDYLGKPVVLNFWASWCGPCKREMPDFQEKFEELGEEVQFLMVNLTDGSYETVDSAAEFIAGQGYTFPVFYDTASDAATTYGVYSIPTTYFINAQGHAIAQATGAIDGETLQRGIDMIK